MIPLKNNPTLRQVCAMAGTGFQNMGQMTMWGLASLSFVKSDESGQQIPIFTPEQLSWFVALPLLMGIPGSIIGGMLIDRFGPRKFQFLMTPVLVVSLLIMPVASWHSFQNGGLAPILLMIIRVIQSAAVGIAVPVLTVYPCEVADAKHRGTLGSLVDFWAYIGYVLCYLLGYYVHWTTSSWVLPLVTFLPSILLLLISPESPVWLATKGREDEALEAFSCLRHTPDEILEEMNGLTIKKDQENSPTFFQSFHLLKQRRNAVPLTISILMLVLKELAGNVAIALFLVDIFDLAGVGLHPNLSSFAVGSIRVLCNLIGALILHRLRRRVILLTGVAIVALANVGFGTIYYLQYSGSDLSHVTWLPLVMLIMFMIGYGIGVGAPTWLVSTEILPNSIRSLGCGINITGYSVTVFLTSKTFNYMQELIGLHGVFWFYAAWCCVYWMLICFLVPETRGRTLKEIEEFWKKSK